MMRLLLGALRARRSHAFLLTVLALLAGAAAAATPRYLVAAAQAVAATDVAAAPASERILSLRQEVAPGRVDTVAEDGLKLVFEHLPAPAFRTVRGLELGGSAGTGGSTGTAGSEGTADTVRLAFRDGVCGKVRLEGRCPAADHEVMVSRGTAQARDLAPGGTLDYLPRGRDVAMPLTVVGVYVPSDPTDPYWAIGGESGSGAAAGAPVFTTRQTITASGSEWVAVVLDLLVRDDAFRGRDPAEISRQAQVTQVEANRISFTPDSGLESLARRVRDDQRLIYVAVPVVALQALLMCWFALFLAVRHTGDERRVDLGLVKLRGIGGLRSWSVIGGQSALPTVVGGLVGAVPGYALAAWLAGPVVGAEALGAARRYSAAAVGAAVLGALVAGLLAEWRTVRAPVVDILRRVPERRSGWRARTVDLVAVALAVAGAYQAGVSGGDSRGMVLLVPGLLAVALGLITVRVLGVVAGRAGRAALRAGRPARVLTAAYLARARGSLRVWVLLTVAVTLLVHAGLGWSAASQARADRAGQELGADRVYTVQAPTRARLLAAVREADPTGRYAMAAVSTTGRIRGVATLAVDTTRLAAVARWRPEYGPVAGLARLLRPAAAAPVAVRGGELTVDASYPARPGAGARLAARLAGPRGERFTVDLGRLSPGRHGYRAATAACAAAGGCRLTGLVVTQTPVPGAAPSPDGLAVVLHAVGQDAPAAEVVGPARMRDRTAWWQPLEQNGTPEVAARDDGLLLRVPGDVKEAQLLVLDAPVPVPVVATGRLGREFDLGRNTIRPFGTGGVPATVVAHEPVLPRLPATGLLMDLEYADRVVADAGGADSMEVWLAPDAPASVLQRLRAAGVDPVGLRTTGRRVAEFAAQGPGLVLRYQLLAVLVGLLLAAGALAVVTAVERPARSAELSALRAQGMADRVVRAVSFGGYPLMVAVFVLLGTAVAVVAAGSLVRFPIFVDRWDVLPPPGAVAPWALAATVGGCLAVLGAVAWYGSSRLLRAARNRRGWSA